MKNIIKGIYWSLLPKKIYGLTGAPGTGKSFRAFLVADKYNIKYIIDDGLLIKDQQIIAGKSAKKEPYKIRAIKTAIFNETKHAREVRKALYKERYRSLLIIGTSEKMLKLITNRLHLPKINKIIKIEDIASEEEIREARKARRKHGKHVMPIPLIEVKKKYPNIILHAINMFSNKPRGFFFKRKRSQIIEKTIVKPDYSTTGKITISETALLQMVSHCIQEYSADIKLLKLIITDIGGDFYLKIKISLHYKINNSNTLREIQNIIKNKIEEFTGITIKQVDIYISKVTQNN
jgi:uncharacterized alkaline shock family protein YloU